ncbi:MAG: hypothetical protein WCF04_10000 [Candidatus Nanopelagicales bacterium]
MSDESLLSYVSLPSELELPDPESLGDAELSVLAAESALVLVEAFELAAAPSAAASTAVATPAVASPTSRRRRRLGSSMSIEFLQSADPVVYRDSTVPSAPLRIL